ncbi:MAG: TRAP transporter small permease [Candidatus Adiutrix sp.]|jgi:C4-dicarboxylate transporter DctQ subunit|nr:TRAP transporter small permease [Candidatus Adiutrix sp.]
MNRLDRFFDKFEEYVCFITLSVMSVAILLQIINRSFLGRPFPYGEELARYMMVWATMIGTSAGVKIGSHVGVDALLLIMPKKLRLAVTFFTSLVALAFFAFAGWLAIELTAAIKDTGQISSALEAPMWLAYLAFPVGFALCLFRQLQLVLAKIRQWRGERAETGGAA